MSGFVFSESDLDTYLKIETKEGFLEGWLFTFDNQTKLVVIESPDERTEKKDFTFIKMDSILNIKRMEKHKKNLFSIKNANINQKKIQSRLQNTIREFDQKAKHIYGKNVTVKAQKIFESLNKTMECNWDNNSIVVLQEVYVNSPYSVDDVVGGSEQTNKRVKLVLSRILNKLK
ncbi:protein lsm12 [Anaeramoeba flamelloides]|uniref:Protein lsm12 n=1 Tax=Anaeramoeba flamelloides TaxID=1746091 RepID=A0AAV8AHD3_9EUKA|nr:protein lsm12 [Anaeramoeba flamelloides]KAJ6248720.1 protein lsm12 [Anaeramoeba flamelloides]